MLGVILFVIPTFFGLMLWSSYRKERRKAEAGTGYAPDGKLRWTPQDERG